MQLTANQQHVLDALRHARGALSAYTLLDQLRPHGFTAPTQIYRALAKLMDGGQVHRLETLNAYAPCSQNNCHHGLTAFTICEHCGHVDEFIDRGLSESIGLCAKTRDFSPSSTTIEIRGTCLTCSDDGCANRREVTNQGA